MSLFEGQCILHESTNWGHFFDGTAILCGHPSHVKGWAICRAKAVPSFLSHFKTLSVGPGPGIYPTTSHSAVKRSTDWANPAVVERKRNIGNINKMN